MPRRSTHLDFAQSTVSNGGVSIAPAATSIPVADGSQFPDTASGKFTIRFPINGEVCRVNTRVGNTFTSVTRGLPEGALGTYSGTTIGDGAVIEEIWGAQDIADVEDYLPLHAATHVPGASDALDLTLVNAKGASLPSLPASAYPVGMRFHRTSDHTLWENDSGSWVQIASGTGGASDATTSAPGIVEVDHAPSGAHPIALTTDGTSLPSGMLGATGTTATAGNDARNSNARTPTGSAGGDLTGTYPNPTLGTSGVSAGTYGDGTHVAAVTLDAKGRVTSASATAITGAPPTGSAGGDLAGTYPNPTLGTSGASAGTYGDATHVPVVTVDAKGRVTSATNTAITPGSISDATTTTIGGVETDRTVSGHPVARVRLDLPLGSSSAAAQPPESVDSVSLLDRLRGGFVSPSPYTAMHNEFDLQWYNGVYYLATPNLGDTATELRHASTLLGLNSASLDVTVATQYPSILYDGTTWHLWGYNGSNDVHHWTASTFGGTYTHVDSVGLNIFDPQVRRNPLDGLYYMAYCANSPFGFAGIAKASSTSGPWTDLGLIFSGAGNPSLALQSYDPTPIFWNGRAYMGMSATPTNPASNNANCLLVELDPSNSYKVMGSPVVVASGPGGNPIFLARPDQPGQEKLFQLTLSGTGYTQVGPAPDDGRRALDGMRLNTTTGADVATGLVATTHGGATWGPNGLKCAATPSGAYGRFGLNALADFTATIEFSLTSIPGADALVLRVSPYAMGANQIGLWVTSGGALKATVIASGTLTLNGVTTLTTGVVYRATILRFGSTVSLLLNGVQETSGTQGSALSGLMEWSVGNDKGQSQASGEQFAGSVYRASISGEALQPVMDALGGLPTLGPVSAYTLPVATTLVLGGVKPDGTTITADGAGVITAVGGTSGQLLVQDGVTNPPVALYTEDGTDFLYAG